MFSGPHTFLGGLISGLLDVLEANIANSWNLFHPRICPAKVNECHPDILVQASPAEQLPPTTPFLGPADSCTQHLLVIYIYPASLGGGKNHYTCLLLPLQTASLEILSLLNWSQADYLRLQCSVPLCALVTKRVLLIKTSSNWASRERDKQT